jgi:hypothetical protein
MLGFYDGIDYFFFTSISKFLDFLTQSKRYNGYKIYAHNGGKFDFLFCIEDALDRRWKIKMMNRSGSLINIRIRTSKTSFQFCDSLALLPKSLAELTKVFDVVHKKQKMKFNEKTVISSRNPKHREYLKYDCMGLYEVLTKFFASEFVVKPQLTIASQSLNTFKEKFLKFDLEAMYLDHEEDIRSNWYAGGRVEVFKGYGRHIRVYDVNSLYPYTMLEEMPCGVPKLSERYERGKIGFYKVKIQGMPELYCSPLLKRIPKGSYFENYYCNGDGYYYLSSAMLEYLKSEFDISFRVDYGYIFPKRKEIFRKFVETFYRIKQENSDNALGFIAKLFLNSLYGKFGQTRWKDSIEVWSKDLKNFVSFDDYYGLMLVTRESHSKFILPYLASYITDLARLIHFKYMNLDQSSLFYCDTDSIFTTSKILDRYISPEIGKLKFLGTYEGVFLAPKSYALRDEKTGEEIVTFKGFDPDEFTFRKFKSALTQGDRLSMQKKKPMSFSECNQFEQMREKGKQSRVELVREDGRYLKVKKVNKTVSSTYNRRHLFSPHKEFVFDTIPYYYEELT